MGSALAAFVRLMHAGFVMAREGVFGLVPSQDLPTGLRTLLRLARLIEKPGLEKDRGDLGARISRSLQRLGPSYVKLGQFMATRPDVVGQEVADELSKLQDRLPPFSQEEAVAVVERSLGKSLSACFVTFGPPVAAASIAQVHKATLRTSEGRLQEVAVKVVRPGVEARFKKDLESYKLAALWSERLFPGTRRLRPMAILQTLAHSVALEMDFRLEAAALSEMAENIRRDQGFRVPRLYWTHVGKEILTIDWIEGVRLSDLKGLAELGLDKRKLAAQVIQHFLRHALRDGFFHADMHQGNLFVTSEGVLVAIDFGIMGRLNRQERRFMAEILYGFIVGDYKRVARLHFEAGYVPPTQDVESFAQAIRAIGEPIHGVAANEISMARLLTQLFEVTALFDMRTQPQLILLQKTMVVVEGVARTLDPELDMWHIAHPVVKNWIESNLGVQGKLKDTGLALEAFQKLLRNFPLFLDRIERVSAFLDARLKHAEIRDTEEGRGSDLRACCEFDARSSSQVRTLFPWLLVLGLLFLLLFS